MYIECFGKWFPELAARETRNVTIFPPERESDSRIPSGTYHFVEFFCSDPKCDCRRVSLAVYDDDPRQSLVTISYGFDRNGELAGPFIDPLNPCCSYGEELFELAQDLLFSDPDYVARLERHYYLVKEELGMDRARIPQHRDRADVAQLIDAKKRLRRVRRQWLKHRPSFRTR